MNWINNFLFVFFPYTSFIVFILGVTYRYFYNQHTYSSLSSQFLEKKNLYFASIPFHFGMLFLIIMHFTAFLFPNFIINFLRTPTKLVIFETIALAFGLSVFIGLFLMILRRFANKRIEVVTTRMDIFIEFILFFQALLGCIIAINFRWGSVWFASSLSPYLWSLINLNPSIDIILNMNIFIKIHVFFAFLIFFVFPFSRLVHILVAPFHYIFRTYQIVRWNFDRKSIKSLKIWNYNLPKNN